MYTQGVKKNIFRLYLEALRVPSRSVADIPSDRVEGGERRGDREHNFC